MNSSNLIALLPMLLLGLGMVLNLLVIAFHRSHALTAGIALATLLLAFLATPLAAAQGTLQVTPLLILDSYAAFVTGLVVAASLIVALLAFGYLRGREESPEEFYLLLLSAALGSSVLAASSHFASFFLGLELLSISLYAMIGYSVGNPISIEAGVKYLILASSSAAFLLFGMALVYEETGTMLFSNLAQALAAPAPETNLLVIYAGSILILVGVGFKLALVPFHLWTPDVYEGAPAPTTAFIASVSKGGVFALLLRFFSPFSLGSHPSLLLVFIIIAVVTMLAGNLLALLQTNLKRLLAYSSIANLGYLLVAFLAGGSSAVTAALFYLVSYFITILAAFGVVTVLSGGSQDLSQLEDYRGLMWRRPWIAAILAAAMFSLAGMPLTVGFMGKLYLVLVGVGSALWLLVITLVVASAIGLYYYLRVVVSLFAPLPEGANPGKSTASLSTLGSIALAGLIILLVGFGLYPAPLLQVIQSLASIAH
jgi:NADH-quinone oxidoreductase subunit N